MTAKEKRFGDEFLLDMNYTQAAIRAGYSESTAKNACYWVNQEADAKQVKAGRKSQYKPELAAYINEQLEQMHSKLTADAQEVVEYLARVLRGQSRSHVLHFVGDGVQEIIEKPPDEKERLKAAELLGKRYGLFKEAVDLEVKASEKLADVMAQIGGDGLEE